MKYKHLMQTEKTRKFIKACEMLVKSGTVKNDAEIIKALGWQKSIFSNVKNGRKNVPHYIFKKFSEVFHPIETDSGVIVEGDFQQMVGQRIATTAAIEALLRTLRADYLELKSKVMKRPYAEVELEFDKIAEAELKHILERMKSEHE